MGRHSKEQSIPLATKGYVLGVRERFIQQTVLSDGSVVGGNISMSDVTQVAFSIEHAAVRMNIRAMGGVNGNIVRSEGASVSLSQKKVSLGVSTSRLALSLSKN